MLLGWLPTSSAGTELGVDVTSLGDKCSGCSRSRFACKGLFFLPGTCKDLHLLCKLCVKQAETKRMLCNICDHY